MDKSPATSNGNMNKFLILIIAAVVLVAAVAVGILLSLRAGDSNGKEFLPNDELWHGEDPSGDDAEHTARY